MKWIKLIAASAALMVMGCSGGVTKETTLPQTTPQETTESKSGEFKVALLTPGPVSDAGWSALAYDGLLAVEKDLGAKISHQEATGPKIRDAMRTYAQDGYSVIFGHGYEYNAPGVELAKDFPNTVFISSSGGETAPNAGALRFYLERSFYLAGMLAAELSKTGKLAMIGGPDVPSIRSTFKGFAAGAKAARPDIIVSEVFTGKDSDIAAAHQATLSAIDAGADFVIHQANAAAQGVFDAAKERGILAFGANANQNDNASGVVLASAVIIVKPVFIDLARQVKEGRYKGSVVLAGSVDLVINPKLASRIPAAIQAKLDQAKADIESGKIVVPKDEF